MPVQAHKRGLHIVWFKRDLRLHDNAALYEASLRGLVLPLYIAEPAPWREADAAGRHWHFIAESLQDLRDDLARLGAPLAIRQGDAVEVLSAIHRDHGILGLWSHQETGNGWTYERDKRVLDWCRANSIEWREPRQNGVIRRLKVRDGWAKQWDRFMALPVSPAPPMQPIAIDVTGAGAIPEASALGLASDPCPARQRGGRREALTLLETFLHGRGIDYRREMSSPLTGEQSCSRLSPHLAWGTLSMREVAQATWKRMAELKADKTPEHKRLHASLVSFSGRLHWHCHFMQKLESEPRLEFENLHPAYENLRPDEANPALLQAWSKGETGFPFVDACMRALAETGWMNFRMRAMLMSFASYHLWLPWRASGLVLARLFTDYEPGIHWPQTQMQSGTTGINTIRIYNPVKQGYDQDPDGVFIRKWVPELNCVPNTYIQEPWKWSEASRMIGKAYPDRIVDHIAAAKSASDRVWGARRGPSFGRAADVIQEKHGSRKSGLSGTRRPKQRRSSMQHEMIFELPSLPPESDVI